MALPICNVRRSVRNGRRAGLKIRCWEQRVGSSPTCATLHIQGMRLASPFNIYKFTLKGEAILPNKTAQTGSCYPRPPNKE